MANSLNKDLLGKRVRFLPECGMKTEYQEAVVTGGFGASPLTAGTALFVAFDDGCRTRMDGYDVAEIVELKKEGKA